MIHSALKAHVNSKRQIQLLQVILKMDGASGENQEEQILNHVSTLLEKISVQDNLNNQTVVHQLLADGDFQILSHLSQMFQDSQRILGSIRQEWETAQFLQNLPTHSILSNHTKRTRTSTSTWKTKTPTKRISMRQRFSLSQSLTTPSMVSSSI